MQKDYLIPCMLPLWREESSIAVTIVVIGLAEVPTPVTAVLPIAAAARQTKGPMQTTLA